MVVSGYRCYHFYLESRLQALFDSCLGLTSRISKQVVVVVVVEEGLSLLLLLPWLRVRGGLGSSMESSFHIGTRPDLYGKLLEHMEPCSIGLSLYRKPRTCCRQPMQQEEHGWEAGTASTGRYLTRC